MKILRNSSTGALVVAVIAIASCKAAEKEVAAEQELSPFYGHIAETLPSDVEQRQIAFERSLSAAAAEDAARSDADQATMSSVIIRDFRRWAPGSTVTVAFPANATVSTAEQQLRNEIEQLAKTWTGQSAANLTLSFRNANGQFREWSTTDNAYAADIRISFAGRGFWSGIGRFTVEPTVFRPNQPSMNLANFVADRPDNWRRVVLHEFGHALGFMHEHQNVSVACSFRFIDDPGYLPRRKPNGAYVPDIHGRRPGLYTWFSGYPNFWNKAKVDSNLGPIGFTTIYEPSDFDHAPFDRSSIMKYYFEPEFFVQGQQSPCFTSEAQVLSAQDKSAAARAYRMAAISEERLDSLETIVNSRAVSAEARRRTATELSELKSTRAAMQ